MGGDGPGGDPGPDYGERLRRARFGLAVVLTSVLMLFVTFSGAYYARHASFLFNPETNTYAYSWQPVSLPTGLLLFNTLLLLASSFTIEMARRQLTREIALAPLRALPGISLGEEGRTPWLGFTVILGSAFLAGQGMAWRALEARGFYLATSASSSFVYLLTATHAIHLALGLLVLVYAMSLSLRHRPLPARHMVVDITCWYWHFMALLWLYIFALLRFAS
jgi:cytochrome c oxidase subunit 3